MNLELEDAVTEMFELYVRHVGAGDHHSEGVASGAKKCIEILGYHTMYDATERKYILYRRVAP